MRGKDSYFTEMISDGLRHGSKLAAKHMSDRKSTLTANTMMSKDENLKGENNNGSA